MTSNPKDDKSKRDHPMRSLGAFFGEIWQAIKTDPARYDERDGKKRNVVHREVETDEQEQGKLVMRETRIREVEIQGDIPDLVDQVPADEPEEDASGSP